MPAICLYFQVHQPRRIRRYANSDIGHVHDYFTAPADDNDLNNSRILAKVAKTCYLPTNAILEKLLYRFPDFRFAFSFTGAFLEQLEEFSPATLASFQRLVKSNRVEILSETYYHSLAFIYSKAEFISQVNLHAQKIKALFGVSPKVFRNTELIYNNDLAKTIADMGFLGIMTEGADQILKTRSPNFLYTPPAAKIKILLKNYRLSDDIAFRFSDSHWPQYPLTAPKYASWLSASDGADDIINLFMDYETFGEHQRVETGIFDFLNRLPGEILKTPGNYFMTPSQAVKKLSVRDYYDVPDFISWADVERDLSAWLGNSTQTTAASYLYALESAILSTNNQQLITDWRRLQTSDHFYYMCTKCLDDGGVHKYFSPYSSPHEASRSFMNVLADLQLRLNKHA